jgi:hypothetical protein
MPIRERMISREEFKRELMKRAEEIADRGNGR